MLSSFGVPLSFLYTDIDFTMDPEYGEERSEYDRADLVG
jgi:hypothetical protein